MAAEVKAIVCKFVGDFEVADNIRRNGNALCKLSETNDNRVFSKLIVIQAGSIVEAALDQIIYRAQNYNREGVPNISEEDRIAIAVTTVEKFNNIIQTMKKYKILAELGEGIYDELHKLRKYRNKVHIQDDVDIEGVSRNEWTAFSDDVVTWSLSLCLKVLNHLNEKYARPAHLEVVSRVFRTFGWLSGARPWLTR
jgi:hypothetical protein